MNFEFVKKIEENFDNAFVGENEYIVLFKEGKISIYNEYGVYIKDEVIDYKNVKIFDSFIYLI